QGFGAECRRFVCDEGWAFFVFLASVVARRGAGGVAAAFGASAAATAATATAFALGIKLFAFGGCFAAQVGVRHNACRSALVGRRRYRTGGERGRRRQDVVILIYVLDLCVIAAIAPASPAVATAATGAAVFAAFRCLSRVLGCRARLRRLSRRVVLRGGL